MSTEEQFPSLRREEEPQLNTGSFVYDAHDPDPTVQGGVEPDYETESVDLEDDGDSEEEWDTTETGDVG